MSKSKSSKPTTYTENDKVIVKTLKDAGKPLTLAEINSIANTSIKSGSITSARRKGLIADAGTVPVNRTTFKYVNSYEFATDITNGDVKVSDAQKEILAVAKTMDGAFTLDDLRTAMNKNIPSGTINALVQRGNFLKGERVKVSRTVVSEVNSYVFKNDIPDNTSNDTSNDTPNEQQLSMVGKSNALPGNLQNHSDPAKDRVTSIGTRNGAVNKIEKIKNLLDNTEEMFYNIYIR